MTGQIFVISFFVKPLLNAAWRSKYEKVEISHFFFASPIQWYFQPKADS
jgi:hypothetical protein